MKIIGSFLGALLFSLATFTANYSGTGSWKSNDGDAGEYTVEASIEQNADSSVSIDQTLWINNEAINVNYVLQKIDDTFFNVLDANGIDIGDGYCWTLETVDDMVCHSVSFQDGFVIESTIKKSARAINRVGSRSDKESGVKLIWKDALILQDS